MIPVKLTPENADPPADDRAELLAMGVRLVAPSEVGIANVEKAEILARVPLGRSGAWIVVAEVVLVFMRARAHRALICFVNGGRVRSATTIAARAIPAIVEALLETHRRAAWAENERRR